MSWACETSFTASRACIIVNNVIILVLAHVTYCTTCYGGSGS